MSGFLLRSKHHSHEQFSTPRPKSIKIDENRPPTEVNLVTPKFTKTKSQNEFVTPILKNRKKSFIQEENEMKEFQIKKEYLEKEIAKYDLEDLQKRQEEEYNELLSTYEERREALYQQTKRLENSGIASKFEQNNNLYNTLREELNRMKDTTRIGKEAIDSYEKQINDTNYILELIPNDTDEVYDLAVRMINSKLTFPCDKGEKINAQLKIEYEDVKREMDILSKFVDNMKTENDTMEGEINELQKGIQELNIERVRLLQTQNNQDMEYLQPKEDLDEQLKAIKKQFKKDLMDEKERTKKEIGALKVEKHILESKYEWVKKQANELQQQFEELNAEIEEVSLSNSTQKTRIRSSLKRKTPRKSSPFINK